MNKFLFLFIINFLYSQNNGLSIKSIFSTEYFSKGSIYNYSQNESTIINRLSLNFSKVSKNISITSSFNFLIGNNISDSTAFLNPSINFENSRGFYNNNSRWYQSSDFEIKYKTDESFQIYSGKKRTQWGEGNSSLFLSNNTPSYPQIGFSWNILELLNFEYFYGILSSQIKDTTTANQYIGVGKRNIFYNRSIAAHKLTWKPLPYIKLNLMELVIFGHRNIDYTYLMPFIPFWSTQSYNGDIDNIQICGEILVKRGKNNIYGSLFIDEWRPEWTFDTINRNWFGYQIGFYLTGLFKKKDLFRMEYTWTDHRVYRHRFQINDSYSHGYSMGFWAGPHAEELHLKYEIPFKNFTAKSFISNMKRGELTSEMLNKQYIETKEDDIYQRYENICESRNILSIKIEKYIFKNQYLIYFENQLINWKNPGFNPIEIISIRSDNYKDINKVSLNIGLTYMMNIKIN